ncbi:MAG: hypothetical protein ACOVLE_04220 [Pirellula staleyi]
MLRILIRRMKILLANSFDHATDSRDELDLRQLQDELIAKGHSVDCFSLPFVFEHESLLGQIMSYRLLDVRQACDKLVAIGAPSHLLRHDNKAFVAFRAPFLLQDFHDNHAETLKPKSSFRNNVLRDKLRCADQLSLRESKEIYCLIPELGATITRSFGVDCKVCDIKQLAAYIGSDNCFEDSSVVIRDAMTGKLAA